MNIALNKKYAIFKALLDKLNLLQPTYSIINNIDTPIRLAKILQYPLIAKPAKGSKKILHNDIELVEYLKTNAIVSETHPLLLEHLNKNPRDKPRGRQAQSVRSLLSNLIKPM